MNGMKEDISKWGIWLYSSRKWVTPIAVGLALTVLSGCEPFGHGHDDHNDGEHMEGTNEIHDAGVHHHEY